MNYFVQGLEERETALALDRDSGTQFLEIVEECQDLEMFFCKVSTFISAVTGTLLKSYLKPRFRALRTLLL